MLPAEVPTISIASLASGKRSDGQSLYPNERTVSRKSFITVEV
jgi:hypothetical protein